MRLWKSAKTQEKALNIALNKISGEWNQELLADLIQDLQDSDFDVGFTGFEPPEIEQLFSKVHDKKVKEDDFDVEAELKKPTVAQTGDVWLLGKHPCYLWRFHFCRKHTTSLWMAGKQIWF